MKQFLLISLMFVGISLSLNTDAMAFQGRAGLRGLAGCSGRSALRLRERRLARLDNRANRTGVSCAGANCAGSSYSGK